MNIGYTTGVFDLFHVGHLNLLRNAKGLCDKLIVGVSTDEVVQYKNKSPVIPFEERIEIVRNIKFVDIAVPQKSIDKYEAWTRLKFNKMFVGDDWYNSESWNNYEEKLREVGVDIIYLPYTPGVSSTKISQIISVR